MSLKCVHQGCGKEFSAEDDSGCRYHPGPPIFHEGQKGWSCCKPRVLTFDEFLSIDPCTEGKHSTTDKPPQIQKKTDSASVDDLEAKIRSLNASAPTRKPIAPSTTPATTTKPTPSPAAPEVPVDTDDDDPALAIPNGKECRRRGCHATYKADSPRDQESCCHHPGAPIFHEGSKGYTCCKRRVLEFDQFLKIEGCQTKSRHLFIGSGGKKTKSDQEFELVETIRRDFYQTATTVIASFFLKKINKEKSTIQFREHSVDLDLITSDATPKRHTASVPLFGPINPENSASKILGTKLELTLVKADDLSWPVLRSDDAHTGEILQVSRAALLN